LRFDPQELSPRSYTMFREIFPNEASDFQKRMARAQVLREDIASTLHLSHKTLRETSKLLIQYFGRIPPHQLSERIAYTFRAFDKDQSGYLERLELSSAFAEMGTRPKDEDIDGWLEEFDADSDGRISLPEFEHMVRVVLNVSCLPHCEQCKRGFVSQFVKDFVAGKISEEDLATETEELAKTMSEVEVRDALQLAKQQRRIAIATERGVSPEVIEEEERAAEEERVRRAAEQEAEAAKALPRWEF